MASSLFNLCLFGVLLPAVWGQAYDASSSRHITGYASPSSTISTLASLTSHNSYQMSSSSTEDTTCTHSSFTDWINSDEAVTSDGSTTTTALSFGSDSRAGSAPASSTSIEPHMTSIVLDGTTTTLSFGSDSNSASASIAFPTPTPTPTTDGFMTILGTSEEITPVTSSIVGTDGSTPGQSFPATTDDGMSVTGNGPSTTDLSTPSPSFITMTDSQVSTVDAGSTIPITPTSIAETDGPGLSLSLTTTADGGVSITDGAVSVTDGGPSTTDGGESATDVATSAADGGTTTTENAISSTGVATSTIDTESIISSTPNSILETDVPVTASPTFNTTADSGASTTEVGSTIPPTDTWTVGTDLPTTAVSSSIAAVDNGTSTTDSLPTDSSIVGTDNPPTASLSFTTTADAGASMTENGTDSSFIGTDVSSTASPSFTTTTNAEASTTDVGTSTTEAGVSTTDVFPTGTNQHSTAQTGQGSDSGVIPTTANPGPVTTPPISPTTTSGAVSIPPVVITASSASTQGLGTMDGSVNTNTHITTTDSEGHETVVPVLWNCFFCGGAGLALWGFGPGPGVFTWPPGPSFTGLPPVTLDKDNNPSVESSTSQPTPTTESCTSPTTAEKYYVTCYVATTSGPTATTTSCETSMFLATGCDVTPTTTTMATFTSTATATCWQYSLTGDHVPPGNDDTTDPTLVDPIDENEEAKKRSIAGRIEYEVYERTPDPNNVLAKRADSWSSFGSCNVGTSITPPPWPNSGQFQNQKLINDGMVRRDQWWYLVEQRSCPEVSEINWKDQYLKSKADQRKVNVDHAYEKALPAQFLATLFDGNNPDECTVFTDLFVDTPDGNYPSGWTPGKQQGNPNKAEQSRLQSLFNMVPNKLNYNFIGVDIGVNQMKGAFFNPGIEGVRNPKGTNSDEGIKTNLNIWNLIGMTVDFLTNFDAVHKVFAAGQNEIYGGFVRFDELWTGCKPMNFAERYKEFMTSLLSANVASIQQYASQVSDSLVQFATTTDENGEPNVYYTAISNLEAKYAPATLSFPTDSYLQFPDTTANIQKRQECTITSAPSTAASGSATITLAPSTVDASAASASASAASESAASASAASASAASASADSASAASASAASASAASASAASASAASASAASASAAAASASAAAAIANKANCYLWDDASLAYAVQVTPIDGWTTGENGKSLKNEEKGCGALTFWHWGTWSNGTQWATFELPTWIKAGCVERAIASAGGPSGLKCHGMGWFHGRYLREDGTARSGGTGGEDGVLAQGGAEATASMLPLAVPEGP